MPVVLGIALNSWKQFVRDRIFYLVVIVAFFLLGFSYLLATLTIVESRKILLDFGFSAISLAGGMMAIYIGIVAVAKEIESRIIYTVVTKPVSRTTYLLGKFLGSMLVLSVTHALLAFTVLGVLRMMSEEVPAGFAVCILLILFENIILLSFAFFCSTFTSSVLAAGITVCFFLIGRSNGSFLLIQERAHSEGVKAIAKFLYLTMPNFERFNLRDVVAYGRPFPGEMISTSTLYAVAYVLICLSACGLVIRSRDLP